MATEEGESSSKVIILMLRAHEQGLGVAVELPLL
jgi:hypothetical protein